MPELYCFQCSACFDSRAHSLTFTSTVLGTCSLQSRITSVLFSCSHRWFTILTGVLSFMLHVLSLSPIVVDLIGSMTPGPDAGGAHSDKSGLLNTPVSLSLTLGLCIGLSLAFLICGIGIGYFIKKRRNGNKM